MLRIVWTVRCILLAQQQQQQQQGHATMLLYPDNIILLGARALLSLTGILTICIGSWQSDREWDDATPQQHDEAAVYQTMEDGSTPKADPPKQPFSKIALLGWVLLTGSYFCSRNTWLAFDVKHFGILLYCTAFLLLFLGVTQTIWIRQAMVERLVHRQRYLFLSILILGMTMEGVLTSMLDGQAPRWASPLGAACVAVGQIILWFNRKRGDSYDRTGLMDVKATLFNFGGPITVFGWFWFWIGMNASHGAPDNFYLPIYYSCRMAAAFSGIAALIIVVWSVYHAQDEAPLEEGQPRPAFGLAGMFCGHKAEIKMAVLLAAAPLIVASFLPYYSGAAPILVFLSLLALTVCYCLYLETGKNNWLKPISGFAVLWCGFLAWAVGWLAMVFAVAALLCMAGGTYLLQNDRKLSQHFTVYSYGALLFPLGCMFMAWSMSFP